MSLILLSLLLVILVLNSWAIWRVFHSPYYSRSQCIAQTAVVIFLPVFGAMLVLYLARTDSSSSSGVFPEENNDAETVGFASDYDVGPHD